MWRITEQDAVRRRLAPGGGDACRQPRCRYCMIPVLVARLAAMEPIEKLFIVMAVIGLVGLVSTVVYLLAR